MKTPQPKITIKGNLHTPTHALLRFHTLCFIIPCRWGWKIIGAVSLKSLCLQSHMNTLFTKKKVLLLHCLSIFLFYFFTYWLSHAVCFIICTQRKVWGNKTEDAFYEWVIEENHQVFDILVCSITFTLIFLLWCIPVMFCYLFFSIDMPFIFIIHIEMTPTHNLLLKYIAILLIQASG